MESKKETVRALLPCKLTENERVDLGITASELFTEIENDGLLLKVLVKERQMQIKEKTKHFNRLVQALKTGVIEREIDAVQVTDYDNRITYLEHQGERHKMRELTDMELNGSDLFDVGSDQWTN